MRLAFLMLILCFFVQQRCWAVDSIQQVPASSPAYKQLLQLNEVGLLYSDQDTASLIAHEKLLTPADFGVQLVEPLQRFLALVQAKDNPDTMDRTQRQRLELASQAVAKLSAKQLDQVLDAAHRLLTSFRGDVEKLCPGLSKQAEGAIRKLHQGKYRTWLAPPTPAASRDHLEVEVNIDPLHNPNNLRDNPLPLTPSQFPRLASPMRLGDSSENIVGTKPLTTFQTAVSFAFKDYKLYGSFSTLPGGDLSNWLKPTPDGQAMLGVSIHLAWLNHTAVNGFVETHVTGVEGTYTYLPIEGIGINW